MGNRPCRARYVGPMNQLRGKSCLARPDPESDEFMKVQFDDLQLTVAGTHMAYGWHRVRRRYLWASGYQVC